MQGQRFLYEEIVMILSFNTKFRSEIFVVLRKCSEGLLTSGVFQHKWCESVYNVLGCDSSSAK